MTPRPSARASTCVGYSSNCSGSSGSDHIHADRIASLLARTAHLTVSHFGSLRSPASPRLPLRRASPAGLMARRPFEHRSIQHQPILSSSTKKPRGRVVMQKNCRQLTPARRILSDAIHRRPCRRFLLSVARVPSSHSAVSGNWLETATTLSPSARIEPLATATAIDQETRAAFRRAIEPVNVKRLISREARIIGDPTTCTTVTPAIVAIGSRQLAARKAETLRCSLEIIRRIFQLKRA
jgi:hypothetical protein